MSFRLKIVFIILSLVLSSSLEVQAQYWGNDEVQYDRSYRFEEGIYMSLKDFKSNAPTITAELERKGDQLYVYDDSLKDFSRVNPNRIWGYAQAGNVYLALEEGYWRVINMGTLAHFTAIFTSTFQTFDSFGFPITRETKSLKHLFLDTRTGEVKELTYEKLKPYLEEDPLVAEKFKRLKRKESDLIIALKAYNEINPLYLPRP